MPRTQAVALQYQSWAFLTEENEDHPIVRSCRTEVLQLSGVLWWHKALILALCAWISQYMCSQIWSYPSSVYMLSELYPLSLRCPYMWLDGYLALWISRMEKNLCVRSLYWTSKISTFLWFSNRLSSQFCTYLKPSEMLSQMSSSLDHFMH